MEGEEAFDCFVVKAISEDFSGESADDSEGWDVFGDDGMGGDDGTVTDGNASADECAVADPYVVTDGNAVEFFVMLFKGFDDRGVVAEVLLEGDLVIVEGGALRWLGLVGL